MKWLTFLLTASTATASVTGTAGIGQGAQTEQVRVAASAASSVDPTFGLSNTHPAETLLEKQALHYEFLLKNRTTVNNALVKLKKTAGKTWYVFSGATPAGWDCSGLVLWTYEQMGITLIHRADAEADSGVKVSEPLPGDIVAFYHKGSDYAFHVGIYLGDGLMIHAYYSGTRTVIQPVSEVVKENWGARVTYTRLLPQPEN